MKKFTRQFVRVSDPKLLAKWTKQVLVEGFVPFPKRLLRALPGIYPTDEMEELAAILAIVDYKRPNLSRLPSLSFLSFTAGLEEKDFAAALNRLKEKDFVEVAGDPDGYDISLRGFERQVRSKAQYEEGDEIEPDVF